MIPLAYYLILSGILFTLGVAGFIVKSDLISVFISIELMLNAVNLSLIAFSHYLRDMTGNLFVFFVMVVARPKPPWAWPSSSPSSAIARPSASMKWIS